MASSRMSYKYRSSSASVPRPCNILLATVWALWLVSVQADGKQILEKRASIFLKDAAQTICPQKGVSHPQHALNHVIDPMQPSDSCQMQPTPRPPATCTLLWLNASCLTLPPCLPLPLPPLISAPCPSCPTSLPSPCPLSPCLSNHMSPESPWVMCHVLYTLLCLSL